MRASNALAVAVAALIASAAAVAVAIGPMGVVSPITAVMSGAIPVTVGLMQGERLTSLAVVGILMAAVAVTLSTAEPAQGGYTLYAHVTHDFHSRIWVAHVQVN